MTNIIACKNACPSNLTKNYSYYITYFTYCPNILGSERYNIWLSKTLKGCSLKRPRIFLNRTLSLGTFFMVIFETSQSQVVIGLLLFICLTLGYVYCVITMNTSFYKAKDASCSWQAYCITLLI